MKNIDSDQQSLECQKEMEEINKMDIPQTQKRIKLYQIREKKEKLKRENIIRKAYSKPTKTTTFQDDRLFNQNPSTVIQPGQIPEIATHTSLSNEQQKKLQKQMKQIIIRRNDLENLIHKTKFQNVITGLFVRLATSTQKMYMLTEIDGIYEGKKLYDLGKTKTNLVLKLKNGDHSIERLMNLVSNTVQFGQMQWTTWFQKNKQYGIPKIQQIKRREEALKKAFMQQNNSQDINKKIEQRIEKVIKNESQGFEDIKSLLQFLNSQKHSNDYQIHQDQLNGKRCQSKINENKKIEEKIRRLQRILGKNEVKKSLPKKQRQKTGTYRVQKLQKEQDKKGHSTKYMQKGQLMRVLSSYSGRKRYLQQIQKLHNQNDYMIKL